MTYVSSVSRRISLGDRYLLLLSSVLLGYALMGRGFAYLGFPPLFIGEIVLFAGFIVLLRTGYIIAALASVPSLLLAMTMAWVLLRTLPFVGVHGVEALRDSVIVIYGGFAFIVITLLLEDARRVNALVRYYGFFLTIYVPAIPFIFALSRYLPGYIPDVPGTTVPLLSIKPGEVAVHLAGAAVFVLVGLRKATLLWTILLLAALAMTSALNRGAMLAFVIPVALAAIINGKLRELATVLVIALAIFAAAYAAETTVTDDHDLGAGATRQVSTRQIVANAESIFVGRSDKSLESTRTWRLEWWNIIVKDTILGPHFWSGRGFGLNLAIADGFRTDRDGEPLRSPHNAHMTILARAGVPGLMLWAALLAAWFAMVMRAMWTARRRGEQETAGLFVWVGCYVMSVVINASFDVALEGPMQGVWFWCVVGFGIGSAMIYRYQTESSS
jgi:O-antigen ligase